MRWNVIIQSVTTYTAYLIETPYYNMNIHFFNLNQQQLKHSDPPCNVFDIDQ